MNLKSFLIISIVFQLTGCATIVTDSALPMQVETKNASGELVSGAECELKSADGYYNVKSGGQVSIERSDEDIFVTCKHPDNEDATGKVISRINAGFFGNALIGGGVGAIIDHTTGNAYTYPSWIQLVFGKFLVFDRSDEKEGLPVTGKPESEEETNLQAKAE
jgi:hypothetical protein